MPDLPKTSSSAALAILLAGGLPAQQGWQVQGLAAAHRSGQTFLTWTEVQASTVPDDYLVYVHTARIQTFQDLLKAKFLGTVPKGAWLNRRGGQGWVLKAGAKALTAGDSFFVATPVTAGKRYYAVLARKGSTTNTWLGTNRTGPITEVPAMPVPILQKSLNNGTELHYAHFAPSADTPFLKAQSNREGMGFNYRIIYDPATKGPRPLVLVLHSRGRTFSSFPPQTWVPKNAVQIFPDDDNQPTGHSLWFGYYREYALGPAPRGKVVEYTERRILWTLDLVLKDPVLQGDPQRQYCIGSSLGAIGAVGLGVRYPDRFAAVGGVDPAFGLRHPDFKLVKEVVSLFGTKIQNLATLMGPLIYDLFDYTPQLTKTASAGLLPMVFTFGRGDGVLGWSDKPSFIKAAGLNRHPASFFWDLRTHGSPGYWSPIEANLFGELFQVRLDRPLPALSKLTLNDDPGNGGIFNGTLIGTFGGYATFDPLTASETTGSVRVDLTLKSDAKRLDFARKPIAYADLTLRRLRSFKVSKGSFYRATSRKRGGTLIEETRYMIPDSKGLLMMPGLELERGYRTVEVKPHNPTLPELQLSGSNQIGKIMRFTLMSAPNQPALIILGSQQTSVSTPFGVWRIQDLYFLWGGAMPGNGFLDIGFPVPQIPALAGAKLLAQGMVGARFTNLSTMTFRK